MINKRHNARIDPEEVAFHRFMRNAITVGGGIPPSQAREIARKMWRAEQERNAGESKREYVGVDGV